MFQKLFSTRISAATTNILILFMRVGTSLLMLTHGYPKLQRLFSEEGGNFPDPLGIGSLPSLVLVTFSEFLGSFMLILGLGTRFFSLALLFTMFVAAIIYHASDPFSAKEPGLLYMILYIFLLFAGGGKYSIDHLINKK
ncbi:MAG: DoxX family protein [Bacteroidota bacterium]